MAVEPITGPTVSLPMPGRIVEVSVKPGDNIKVGDKLVVYEAMKMENEVESPIAGVIKRVLVQTDEAVKENAPVVEFE